MTFTVLATPNGTGRVTPPRPRSWDSDLSQRQSIPGAEASAQGHEHSEVRSVRMCDGRSGLPTTMLLVIGNHRMNSTTRTHAPRISIASSITMSLLSIDLSSLHPSRKRLC